MKDQIVIKIDGEKKEALTALAKKQGISLSGLIRKTLYGMLNGE